jgi:hypothetical protein
MIREERRDAVMSAPAHRDSVRYAEKEVNRFQQDVEDWKSRYQELEKDCWLWEDGVAKANFLFDRLTVIDSRAREQLRLGELTRDEVRDEETVLRSVLSLWLAVAEWLLVEVERIERVYGRCAGASEFRKRLEEARRIMTPDIPGAPDDDSLATLREQPAEEHTSVPLPPGLRDLRLTEEAAAQMRAALDDDSRPAYTGQEMPTADPSVLLRKAD